jgi:hypothetical protein
MEMLMLLNLVLVVRVSTFFSRLSLIFLHNNMSNPFRKTPVQPQEMAIAISKESRSQNLYWSRLHVGPSGVYPLSKPVYNLRSWSWCRYQKRFQGWVLSNRHPQ